MVMAHCSGGCVFSKFCVFSESSLSYIIRNAYGLIHPVCGPVFGIAEVALLPDGFGVPLGGAELLPGKVLGGWYCGGFLCWSKSVLKGILSWPISEAKLSRRNKASGLLQATSVFL